MTILIPTLIIIVCVLLILIVLVQNPKGGGLSSTFGGGGSQLFGGVKKTTDFLDRGTWVLAIVLVVLVLFANVTSKPIQSDVPVGERDSKLTEQIEEGVSTPPPTQIPTPEPDPALDTEPVGEDK